MLLITLLRLISADVLQFPLKPNGDFIHFQSFDDDDWEKKWIVSGLNNVTGKWVASDSKEPQGYPGERLLTMKSAMAYYGASTKFSKPLVLKDKTLVLQYEVRFQEPLECGGAYIKLFSTENFEPTILSNETKYSIMFGPDKCGTTNKVHFIFRHKNPISGVIEEKHMKDAPSVISDQVNHLYTLIVRPDNTFEILIDGESVKQGSLLSDFEPSVNPPKEIDDPSDIKPSDWVDDEMIPDPTAVKPDDWDESEPEFIPDPSKLETPAGWLVNEPRFIPDTSAQKPDSWDDDIHGDWEPPTVPNPKCENAPGCGEYEAPLIQNEKYKGKWSAPMIKNPEFKGVWKPRQIPNPHYFEDKAPHNFMPIAGAGFELWMVNKEIGFTNVFIGNDEAVAHKWNKDHFKEKSKLQKDAQKELDAKLNPGKGFVEKLGTSIEFIKEKVIELRADSPGVFYGIMFGAISTFLALVFLICKKSPKPPKAEKPEKPTLEKTIGSTVEPTVEEPVSPSNTETNEPVPVEKDTQAPITKPAESNNPPPPPVPSTNKPPVHKDVEEDDQEPKQSKQITEETINPIDRSPSPSSLPSKRSVGRKNNREAEGF